MVREIISSCTDKARLVRFIFGYRKGFGTPNPVIFLSSLRFHHLKQRDVQPLR